MTIHSGFATRKQETDYNKCLEALIVVLFKRIAKIYTNEVCDEHQFNSYLQRILSCMFELEDNKYQPPKFSKRADNLCSLLSINYKQNHKQAKKETAMPKGSNFSTICNQIRRNYTRIQSYQGGSSHTLNTLDGNTTASASCILGNDNLKNSSTQNGNSLKVGNTSFSQQQQQKQSSSLNRQKSKEAQGLNNSIHGGQSIQKRGESSNSQYKERYVPQNSGTTRPKSSSTQSSGNYSQKQMQENAKQQEIKIAEKNKNKIKKYQDYLEKYNEDYFKDLSQSDIGEFLKNKIFDEKNEGEQLQENNQDDEDTTEIVQTGKHFVDMEYSDDSTRQKFKQEQEEYQFQDEDELMKNIEDIENEQIINCSPLSFSPQKLQNQKRGSDFHLKDNNDNNNPILEQQNKRYIKSNSALACSLNVRESQENQNNQNINRNSMKSLKEIQNSSLNSQLLQSQSQGSNVQVSAANQSFAVQRSSSAMMTQEKKKKMNFEEDVPEQETAHFKDLSFLTQSKVQQGRLLPNNKEQKRKEENSISSKQKNLTIRQPRFSLSVDEDEKKETTKNESQVSTKSPSHLNIIVPGKKGVVSGITEEYIKANSPQFCQTQIDTIKQQLSLQTTYLQIQQQQLDQKLNHQQTELQKQLQHNQIVQQQILKGDSLTHKKMSNQENMKQEGNICSEGSSSHSQQYQQQSQIEEIQEEEEEEESIYKGSTKAKRNKIQLIQLRQLNKEKLIQTNEGKQKQQQQIFVAEEINFKFDNIKIGDNDKQKKSSTISNIAEPEYLEINKNQKIKQKSPDQLERDKNNVISNDRQNVQRSPEIMLQPSNNQIKRRVKILSCHSANNPVIDAITFKQKTLKDISNFHQNQQQITQKEPKDSSERCNTDQMHERSRMPSKKTGEQQNKEFMPLKNCKTLEHDNSYSMSECTLNTIDNGCYNNQNTNLQRRTLKDFHQKKSSLEPVVPKIQENNHQKIIGDTPKNQIPPLSTQSKRSRTHDYTNSSPIHTNVYFQQSPQPKVTFINENNYLQRGQFKITKKKETLQSFRDQLGDSIKELSTEIYTNNSNINSKKNEQLTPFWGDDENQKQPQLKDKNAKGNNYSFYNKSIEPEQISLKDENGQNSIISNIVNCPLNPKYMNKLIKQSNPKKVVDKSISSPKMNINNNNNRPSTSHAISSTTDQQRLSTEFANSSQSALGFMQHKLPPPHSNSNSPISMIAGSGNNKKQSSRLTKVSQRESYFKF